MESYQNVHFMTVAGSFMEVSFRTVNHNRCTAMAWLMGRQGRMYGLGRVFVERVLGMSWD